MLGLDILDVAIGVVFTFCLLSLVATSLREMIEAWLQVRAVTLERGIRELLSDKDGTKAAVHLFAHPLISSLFRGTYDPAKMLTPAILPWVKDDWKRLPLRSTLPSYIPSRNFALALMDFAGAGGSASIDPGNGALTPATLRQGILKIPDLPDPTTGEPDTRLKQALLVAVDQAQGDMETVRVNLEKWFDSGMDRVSGWYRKHTQWLILLIGLILAIGLNVDAIRLASALQTDAAMRSVVVAEAEAVATQAKVTGATNESLKCDEKKLAEGETCAQYRLQHLNFPIGWNSRPVWFWEKAFWDESAWRPAHFWQWIGLIFGWLITAFAISIGAPFWFDTLNRLMVIRSTVKPHEKSQEEASEDRQDRDHVLALKIQQANP